MRVVCNKCGGPHPAWECRASEAQIMVSPRSKSQTPRQRAVGAAPKAASARGATKPEAGELIAAAHGTKGAQPKRGLASPASNLSSSQAANTKDAPKRGRGRPRTITDMAAYKRDKARQYRAAAKLAKEGK